MEKSVVRHRLRPLSLCLRHRNRVCTTEVTYAFGNALGSSVVGMATQGSQQEVQLQGAGPYSAAGYRNGMDIDSDNFNPASAYGYRNGMDIQSDRYNPASAFGYRNGSDIASDSAYQARGNRALLNETERLANPGYYASVTGSSMRAGNGASISGIVGTSNPQAIGNFMRANNMTTDRVQAGGTYFVPESTDAYGDQRGLGQRALNAGNARIQAARMAADAQAASTDRANQARWDAMQVGAWSGRANQATATFGSPGYASGVNGIPTGGYLNGVNGIPTGGYPTAPLSDNNSSILDDLPRGARDLLFNLQALPGGGGVRVAAIKGGTVALSTARSLAAGVTSFANDLRVLGPLGAYLANAPAVNTVTVVAAETVVGGSAVAPSVLPPKMVQVYRGTNLGAENHFYAETGHLLSDAARQSYGTTGSVTNAYRSAGAVHDKWIDIWGNENQYVQAHGAFGLELPQAFKMDRTFISVTTDLKAATYFSQGGTVYGGLVPESILLPQTLAGAGESEFLLRLGTTSLKPIPGR